MFVRLLLLSQLCRAQRFFASSNSNVKSLVCFPFISYLLIRSRLLMTSFSCFFCSFSYRYGAIVLNSVIVKLLFLIFLQKKDGLIFSLFMKNNVLEGDFLMLSPRLLIIYSTDLICAILFIYTINVHICIYLYKYRIVYIYFQFYF